MASLGPRTPPLAPSLTLQTLGGTSLRMVSGAEVLGPGKPLALLIYLACEPRATASRTHLLDLLWSDTEPDRARHALRQAIWYLRQVLGPDVLRTSNSDLVLEASIPVDRNRLLVAVSRGQCEEAVALYAGEFLRNFAVPGGAGFEHWADVERQRLRAAFQRAAERTVRRWIDAGRFRDAQALARRVHESAPSDESGWRLMLETLHATGDHLSLAMESAELRKELAQDGRSPEPATRALLATISREVEPADGASANPLLAELVGREQQFAQSLAAWHRVSQGRAGQHLHILAPAGYGKSRLMHDVQVRLQSLGVRTVTVRATPGQRDIAYSCASDLIAALATLPGAGGVSPATAAVLVALNPSLSSRYPLATGHGTSDDPLHRRSSAIAELCSVVAEEGPFALLLDDLHWIDGPSRQIVRTLLERVEQYPCLALTSARPGSDQVTFSGATQTLVLPPLSVENVSRLLSSLGSLPDDPWARDLPLLLCQSTAGSPLLILESLRLTIDRGDLQLQGNQWSCVRPAELRGHLSEGRALRHRHDQLTSSERETLLLLAAAGEDIPTELLTSATRLPEAVIVERLGALEQKGFVQRSAGRWVVLHDEIARESLLAAAAADQSRAHAMLGTALAVGASRRGEYIRAARHLALADRQRELREVVIGYARLVRSEGDSRRMAYLIRDLLPDAELVTVNRMLALLGRWNRLRYTPFRPVLASAGTIAALLLASVALRQAPDIPPDLDLLVVPEDSAQAPFSLPIRAGQFLAAERLDLTRGDRPRLRMSPGMGSLEFTADGRCVYYSRYTGDRTTSDIFRQCGWQPEERIFSELRDDGFPTPSPDGRRLVFVTSQWSLIGADNYDLAMLDLTTGRLSPLVRTRSHMERRPSWSPDGTQIVFIQSRGSLDSWLMVVPPDSGSETRELPNTRGIIEFGGWINGDQLLINMPDTDGMLVARYTLSTGRLDTLARQTLTRINVSQDGRWFTTTFLPPGHSRPHWYLVRTESPGEPRELELTGDAELVRMLPVSGGRQGRALDSLAIVVGRPELTLGVSHQLKLTAYNRMGKEMTLETPVRWSVSPTDRAIIDSAGRITPVSGDGVDVLVSLPGWRSTRLHVRFREDRPEQILSERWTEPLETRWIPFGDPRPRIVSGPDRVPAFLNNGNGSYPSGAYLRNGWDLATGLAVEVRLSTRITRPQWQTIAVELCGGCDSAAQGAWDHRSGQPAYEGFRKLIRSCSFSYPSGEGEGSEKFVSLGARASYGRIRDDSGGIATGAWHTFLLQLFPDGRCGLAINGVGQQITRTAVTVDRRFHVMLTGHSANTQILVGPMTVWRGIRDHIDWSGVQ